MKQFRKPTSYSEDEQRARYRKAWPKFALALFLPACFAFWFITAPACMAVQRIAAGSGNGPIARFTIRATDSYEAPMAWFYKFRTVKRFDNFLTDWWCDVLDAPETTP